MFRESRTHHMAAIMGAVLSVLSKHRTDVPIKHIQSRVSASRDEISNALKNLREEGFARSPSRGIWRLTVEGERRVDGAQKKAGADTPALSYAEIHARAIAAEDRAQGLAEQLAEERQRRERAEQDLRECGEAFQQLRYVTRKLRKRARRLDKERARVERLLRDLDIKDPTIPF